MQPWGITEGQFSGKELQMQERISIKYVYVLICGPGGPPVTRSSAPATRPKGSQAEPGQRCSREFSVLIQSDELSSRVRYFEDAERRSVESATAAFAFTARGLAWLAAAAGAETV